jgi:hypothetical protein
MSRTCDCALPGTLLRLGEHEELQAVDERWGQIERTFLGVWRHVELWQCGGAEESECPGGVLGRVSWAGTRECMTDLIIEGCALQTVLAGPVLCGSELGVEGGEVEQRRGPFKGQTAEGDGDRRGGKDVRIGKLEADLVCGSEGIAERGRHGRLRGALRARTRAGHGSWTGSAGSLSGARDGPDERVGGGVEDARATEGVPVCDVLFVEIRVVLGVLVQVVAHPRTDLRGICFFQGDAEMVWHLVATPLPLVGYCPPPPPRPIAHPSQTRTRSLLFQTQHGRSHNPPCPTSTSPPRPRWAGGSRTETTTATASPPCSAWPRSRMSRSRMIWQEVRPRS